MLKPTAWEKKKKEGLEKEKECDFVTYLDFLGFRQGEGKRVNKPHCMEERCKQEVNSRRITPYEILLFYLKRQ